MYGVNDQIPFKEIEDEQSDWTTNFSKTNGGNGAARKLEDFFSNPLNW